MPGTKLDNLPKHPCLTAVFLGTLEQADRIAPSAKLLLEGLGFEIVARIEVQQREIAGAEDLFHEFGWQVPDMGKDSTESCVFLLLLDVFPIAVPRAVARERPHLENGRTHEALYYCRRVFASDPQLDRAAVGFEVTATSAQAMSLLHRFAPAEVSRVVALAESRLAAVATHFEVVGDMSRYSRRAKVELVRYGEALAVKKTFRHQFLRLLDRECSFLENIAPLRAEMLPVLERGPNYFITPFVESRLTLTKIFGHSFPKLLPLNQVRQLARLVRFLLSRGYDPVDFTPHNVLIDRAGRIFAIDFEFVHKACRAVEPEESACLTGVGDNFPGEYPLPFGFNAVHDPYGRYWYRHTGLSLKSFLHDPPALQAVKRCFNYPLFIAAKTLQPISATIFRRPRQREDLALLIKEVRRRASADVNGW